MKRFLALVALLAAMAGIMTAGYLLSPAPPHHQAVNHQLTARDIASELMAHFEPPGHKARAV